MQIREGILFDTLMPSVCLGLEEEMVQPVLILNDIRIDGGRMEVEQHLRLCLQSAEIIVGIAPIHAVVRDRAVIGQQREVNHILACRLIVDGLRRPDAGYVGKVGSAEPLGEMNRMMLPVNQVARTQQHHTPVAGPTQGRAHICHHQTEPSVPATQDVRVANAFGQGYGIACHNGLSAVQRCVVKAVGTHGIAYLLLLGGVARKIGKQIVFALDIFLCICA